jgi:hypothetical protein
VCRPQIREIQNNFFIALTNAAPGVVDKHSNATDETEFERLPEEVQAMLGDKDTLVNAIQVCVCTLQ